MIIIGMGTVEKYLVSRAGHKGLKQHGRNTKLGMTALWLRLDAGIGKRKA